MTLHTYAIYVEDKPGVLNRVASLFRRRGFNIHSLAVGHSEIAGVSRMTAVIETDDCGAQRMQAHLYKIVHVLRVDDITSRPSIVRDLALIKVTADQTTRSAVVQLAQVFTARIVDVAPDSMVLEMCASEARIDGLLDVLQPYGVLEMVRTGRIAMERGSAAEAAVRPGVSPAAEDGVSYSV